MMPVWQSVKDSRLVKLLGKPGRGAWWDSLMWLMWTVIGGFLPIYGGMYLLKLFSQPVHLNDFIRHGEFALYSASFLGPALGLILRDIKGTTFFARPVLGMLAGVGIIFSTLAFAGLTAVASVPTSPISKMVNEEFLFVTSIFLLVFTLALSFYVTLLDEMRTPRRIDVAEVVNSDARKLEDQFDATKSEG